MSSCSDSPMKPGESYSTRAPLATVSTEFDGMEFLGAVLDAQLANDVPAQSDLNAFTRADNVSGKIGVKWYWDDINSWTGSGQTGDACALFDTDNDTKANVAVCVRITNPGGDPAIIQQLDPGSPLNYTCGDSKADRCASPVRSQALAGIVCEVAKVEGETFFTEGEDGADVEAACSIPLSAIGTNVTPNLLNVCSFPSGSPQSNPFDCVVTPGAGFLVIKKATTPQSSNQTFNFKILPKPVGDSLQSIADNSSSDEQTALLSASPGNYSVSELALPSGWQLASAACARQTTPDPTATGTKSGNTMSGVSVTSGETTVCTFTNQVTAPTITLVKTATPDSIPETGGSVSYSLVVSNTATIPVTLDSIKDNVFSTLGGTCNSGGNPYGTIAVGGSYSCSFSKTLSASNAGQYHINMATTYVSSDGGPASASDTARVKYYDVKPNITVTKSADVDSIVAAGGTSVAGFNPDATFSTTSSGGGSTPVYLSSICDDKGANDEPAQSDVNCFSRADNIAGRLWIKWTWDDVNSWTGSGQTGDACALIDTDNNGFANFAFCDRISNPDGNPEIISQVATVLYRCKDAASDRCASKVFVAELDATSICNVQKVADQIPGGEDGFDSEAECNLKLTDLGQNVTLSNIDLLNVCSFPSGSPNSNPFDCVVSPTVGFLVIIENTTPANANSYFAFTLRNGANTANDTTTSGQDQWAVKGGVTSAPLPILPGTYALRQQMPVNWTLTSISCLRDGNPVGTTSGDLRTNLTIVSGATTICTFTNTLSASATVTFTVTVTNNRLEDVTLSSLEDSENPDAGTPTYSTLNSVGTCATGGTIVNGTPYSCTFTRVVSGSPGAIHKDKIKAVAQDNDGNSDTKYSGIVSVPIK